MPVERGAMTYAFQNTLKHSVEVTNEWVNELDEAFGWEDKNRSFRVMRAVLHELRDMLLVDEAAQLSAQMPLFIRGLFFEEWNPSKATAKSHDKQAFLARVVSGVANEKIGSPEKAVSAVFTLLNSKISAGELNDVRDNLNAAMQKIWSVN